MKILIYSFCLFSMTVFASQDLITAVRENNIGEINRLLASETSTSINDVAQDNPDKRTALMYAALIGKDETVKLILQKGPDINQADNKGNTALHFAASFGHSGVVFLLLKHGANIESTNNAQQTALMIAADRLATETNKNSKNAYINTLRILENGPVASGLAGNEDVVPKKNKIQRLKKFFGK